MRCKRISIDLLAITVAIVVLLFCESSNATGNLSYRGYSGFSSNSGQGYRGYGNNRSFKRYGFRSGYSRNRFNKPHGRRYQSRGYNSRHYRPYRNYSGSQSYRRSYGSSAYFSSAGYGTHYRPVVSGYDESLSFENQMARDNTAWDLLFKGHHTTAMSLFARQAQENPDNGIYKAGYAMANASLGNLTRAVWAMRRAFRMTPESLHYLTFGPNHSIVAKDLIRSLKDDRDLIDENYDAAFMIASLSYLQHDYDAARKYADLAALEGDGSESLRNLKRLIKKQS